MKRNRIEWAQAILLLFALLVSACSKKNPDPNFINIQDFDSDKALTDTLRKMIPPGTRVLVASEAMQSKGFKCGERAPMTVDTKAGTLGSGTPHLECGQSSPIEGGLRHRDWTVTFDYDSAGVRDVQAGFIIQP